VFNQHFYGVSFLSPNLIKIKQYLVTNHMGRSCKPMWCITCIYGTIFRYRCSFLSKPAVCCMVAVLSEIRPDPGEDIYNGYGWYRIRKPSARNIFKVHRFIALPVLLQKCFRFIKLLLFSRNYSSNQNN